MTKTLTISEDLFRRLEGEAKRGGFSDVESLLLATHAEPVFSREQLLDKIGALRNRLSVRYGLMLDSTDLIREDRAR